MRPPAKFCKFPDKAIPTATPADANKAANEVVSTPSLLMTATISRTVSKILTKLLTKLCTLGSTLRRARMRATSLLRKEIRMRPIMKIRAAANRWLPASTPQSQNFCTSFSNFVMSVPEGSAASMNDNIFL